MKLTDELNATQYHLDKRSYLSWFLNEWEGGLTKEDIRKRRALVIGRIVHGELSEKQQLYLTEYLYNDLNTSEIAIKYNVHCSTVSRTIERGFQKLFRILYYLAPEIGLQSGSDLEMPEVHFFTDVTTGKPTHRYSKRFHRHANTRRV